MGWIDPNGKLASAVFSCGVGDYGKRDGDVFICLLVCDGLLGEVFVVVREMANVLIYFLV